VAGEGLHANAVRPGWAEERARLERFVAELPPALTLDVACGTGFLTRHLRGDVTGLDQSEAMLELARERAPQASYVRGDGLALPFPDASFDRVFTSHFYGHLRDGDRERFLREARRLAGELVAVDSARGPDGPREQVAVRRLSDGSVHRVFKRWFEPEELAREIGGDAAFAGAWFVAAAARS
jgi:ubiquinone/menaquinone biosynthesis C-methylase UbiE